MIAGMIRLLAVLVLLSAAAAVVPAPAAAGPLEVGGYTENIDPKKVPVSVVGNFTARYASEVVEPLAAQTLVIGSGQTRIAIQTIDSCVVPRPLMDRAKQIASNQTGIPVEHLFCSATHTHSAPSAFGGLGTDPDPAYVEQLVGQIAESIIQADRRRQPCEVGWGRREAEDYAFNRRWLMKPGTAFTVPFTGHAENQVQFNPGNGNPNKIRQVGGVDPAVTVLAFRDPATKRPLAVLANFNTHYAGAPMMSSDYFGIVCRELGAKLDPDREPADGFTAPMSNGHSGDVNCIDFSADERIPFDHTDVAGEVMEKAVAAYRGIDRWHADLPLAVAHTDFAVKKRLPTSDEVAAAKAAVAPWIDRRLPETIPEVYARETIFLSQTDPVERLRLQSFRLGGFAAATIPCEVYTETGVAIKEQSPFAMTITIGWANGYSGYLPPPRHHALGGYTTWRCRSSFLEEEAEPKIVAEIQKQLRELHQTKLEETGQDDD